MPTGRECLLPHHNLSPLLLQPTTPCPSMHTQRATWGGECASRLPLPAAWLPFVGNLVGQQANILQQQQQQQPHTQGRGRANAPPDAELVGRPACPAAYRGPAMEMTVAARSVHSTVYDPEGKTLDPQVRSRLCGAATQQRGCRGPWGHSGRSRTAAGWEGRGPDPCTAAPPRAEQSLPSPAGASTAPGRLSGCCGCSRHGGSPRASRQALRAAPSHPKHARSCTRSAPPRPAGR